MAEKDLAKKESAKLSGDKQSESSHSTVETYTVEELANVADKLFGVTQECVIAAFRIADKNEATEEEAKELVLAFLNKEVK